MNPRFSKSLCSCQAVLQGSAPDTAAPTAALAPLSLENGPSWHCSPSLQPRSMVGQPGISARAMLCGQEDAAWPERATGVRPRTAAERSGDTAVIPQSQAGTQQDRSHL